MNLKRLTALFIASVLSVSLIACSDKSLSISPKNETTTATATATQQATTSQTEEATKSDGAYTKPVITNGKKSAAEFTAFADDSFKEIVTGNLIDLHYYVSNPATLGITEYDKTFGEVDISKLNDATESQEMLDKLKEFNYSALSTSQKQTYDILFDALTNEVNNSEFELYSFTFGKSFGINSNLPVLLAEYTLNNENDVKEYIELLNTMPDYYKALMDVEKERSKYHLCMSDELINGIISQCTTFVENPEENFLIKTFDTRINALEGMDAAKKNEYIAANKKAVLESVIPAYNYLITEFTGLLGKGSEKGGISNFSNYRSYFEYFLRSSVGTDKTPDEVNALLKKYAAASFTAVTLGLAKDTSIINNIEAPPYPITEPEAIITDLKSKISTDFPTVPEVTCKLHEVDPSLSDFLSPAFYITSPVDNNKLQNIYINNGANASFSGLYPTLAHEGYPGHLYQNLYYSTTNHEKIRDVLSFTGYSEGWATYVEMMSYNYSGLDSNLADVLANYNVYMLCLYGQMDLGLNYYGWNYDKLSQFIEKNFGTNDADIVNEFYNLFIEKPGNYLHYIFGYIELMELKKTASDALGSSFKLKEFHKYFLDFGPAPFYIIRDYLDDWIKTQK